MMEFKELRLELGLEAGLPVQDLPLISCVTSDMSLNLSGHPPLNSLIDKAKQSHDLSAWKFYQSTKAIIKKGYKKFRKASSAREPPFVCWGQGGSEPQGLTLLLA